MKKTLVISVALTALALSACGESEKQAPGQSKENVTPSIEGKPAEKVELPKVDVTKIKKPALNNDLFVQAKKDLLSDLSGTQDKAKKSLLSAKEKGLTFLEKSKEDFAGLKGMMKDEYEIKLKDYKLALSAVEIFLSDKYDGTNKQSFYFSEVATNSSIGFFEAQFDDMTKEMKFVVKEDKKWTVYETKAEAEKRMKELKAFIAKKKAEYDKEQLKTNK